MTGLIRRVAVKDVTISVERNLLSCLVVNFSGYVDQFPNFMASVVKNPMVKSKSSSDWRSASLLAKMKLLYTNAELNRVMV